MTELHGMINDLEKMYEVLQEDRECKSTSISNKNS